MKLFTLLLLTFTLQAAASPGCYTPSPNAMALGDTYYALDQEITLDDASTTALQQFLQALSGRWHGDLIETACTGPDHKPKRLVSQLNTRADLSINSKGELLIKARKHGYADLIERGETIQLFARESMYHFDHSNNMVNATEKMRIRSKNGTSRLLETISSLTLNDNVLNMRIDYFSNGIYVQTLDFRLTR